MKRSSVLLSILLTADLLAMENFTPADFYTKKLNTNNFHIKKCAAKSSTTANSTIKNEYKNSRDYCVLDNFAFPKEHYEIISKKDISLKAEDFIFYLYLNTSYEKKIERHSFSELNTKLFLDKLASINSQLPQMFKFQIERAFYLLNSLQCTVILGYDLKLPASIINNLLFDLQKQLENSKYGTKLEIKPIFKNFSQITLVLCPNQNDFLKKDCEGDKIYYSDFSSIFSISAPKKQEWLAKTFFMDGAYIAIDAISGQTRAVPMAFYSEITSAFDFMHNQAIQRIPKIETMKFNEPTRLFKK